MCYLFRSLTGPGGGQHDNNEHTLLAHANSAESPPGECP
jgi:hypothetical protein